MSVLKKYVNGKVKALKWRPTALNAKEACNFVYGTWDSQDNTLASYELTKAGNDPSLLQEISVPADVNCLQYMNKDTFAVGLGNGNIYLFSHDEENKLKELYLWEQRHFTKGGPASCNGIACNGDTIASVGEDGMLNILSLLNKPTVSTIDSGKGCNELAVIFSKANEVLTSSLHGHLRLWDLRLPDVAKEKLISPDQLSVNSLASHPTQQHIIAAGCEDGSLSLWDMRMVVEPFALISAHNGEISDVQFHPNCSHHLFTSGVDGQLLHWDSSFSSENMFVSSVKRCRDAEELSLKNAWLRQQVAAGMVDTVNLLPSLVLPINTVSIESTTLLAGSDNEAVFIIHKNFK